MLRAATTQNLKKKIRESPLGTCGSAGAKLGGTGDRGGSEVCWPVSQADDVGLN